MTTNHKKDSEQDKRISNNEYSIKLILEKFDTLGQKVDDLKNIIENQNKNYVSKIEYDICKDDQEKRLKKLESWWDKIIWVIISAIIIAGLALLFK